MFKKFCSRYLFVCTSLFVLLSSTGCSNNHDNPNNISGSAIKGVISNGIVKVYSTNKEKILLAESRTNQFGQFTIDLSDTNQSNTLYLLELSVDKDTKMRCDLTIGCLNSSNGQLVSFGDNIQLPSNFKLLGLSNNDGGNKVSSFISPLSHLIVSTALKNNQNLNIDTVTIATKWVKDALKLTGSPLQTQPKDITQLTNLPNITDEQLKHSVLSAAMYPETLTSDWSLGNESIDTINLKDILSRAAELAGDLSGLVETDSPNQAEILNRIQSDAEAQLVTLNTPEIIILTQPSSLTTTEHDAFSLYVQANSDLNLHYQWYKNGGLISGANSAIYSNLDSSLSDSGLYHVVVSNEVSELQSLSASVTVNEAAQELQITQQPQGLSITAGDPISLRVNASGDGTIQYQWQKNGSLIPGATSSSYNIANSQTTDAGSYRVVISNGSKQINSNFVNVWVTEAVQAISISKQPQSQAIPQGNSVSFNVSANGGGYIGYQWRKNGININNAYSNSFAIASVSQLDSGNYDVIISNSQGSVTSTTASLSVISNSVPVMITHQPLAQTIITGSPFTLNVSASGDSPISYQWFLDGNAIAAANSAQYKISSASIKDQGQYTALVSNPNSSELSNVAQITINQPPLSSIELSWDPPKQREDGSPLAFSEIQSYIIEYGNNSTNLQNRVEIDNILPNTFILDELSPGTLFLRIATVDSDSRQGAFSQTISITIQ